MYVNKNLNFPVAKFELNPIAKYAYVWHWYHIAMKQIYTNITCKINYSDYDSLSQGKILSCQRLWPGSFYWISVRYFLIYPQKLIYNKI